MDMISAAPIVALAVSATAATISLRALTVNRRASQLPVIVQVLGKWREIEFMHHEELLWREMSSHDPALGFQNLPDPMKDSAFDVCQYYQCLAYLSVHNIADYRVIAPQVHYRARRTWSAIQQHVAGERVLRGGEHTFFNMFEIFVQGLNRLDTAAMGRKALRRSRRWPGR